MDITISVIGLSKIERNLKGSILLDPHIAKARDKFVERIVRRPGKGLGARSNTLSPTIQGLGARVSSTTNWPRTVGSSWTGKNVAIARSMGPRVIKAAIRDIEAAWAAPS